MTDPRELPAYYLASMTSDYLQFIKAVKEHGLVPEDREALITLRNSMQRMLDNLHFEPAERVN